MLKYTWTCIHKNTHTHEHVYTRTHIQRYTKTHSHTPPFAILDLMKPSPKWQKLWLSQTWQQFQGELFLISHVGKILQTQSFGFENKILKRKTLKQESRKQTHKHNIFCLKIIHFRQPVLSITDFKINRMFLHIYIWTPYSLYHMCFCSFWDRFPFFAAVQVPQMMTAQMDRRLSCEPPYSLPVSNSSTQSRVS